MVYALHSRSDIAAHRMDISEDACPANGRRGQQRPLNHDVSVCKLPNAVL